MQYDPIKRVLGRAFNRSPFLRKLFYRLLDLLLLRAWHVHRELRQWARGRRYQPARILDAGSGFGQYTWYLSRMNPRWEILAVDVKEDQVEDCNRFFRSTGRSNVEFRVEDLTRFEQPGSFDLILSVDVMEHIEDDVGVFRHFAASLKPGGRLIISTPSDQGGSDVHDDHEESFIGEHVRDGYGREEIRDKLLRAGFSDVRVRYSYGRPGQVSWRLSMKYPLLMLNRSKAFFVVLPLYYLLTYPVAWVLNRFDVLGNHRTGTGLIVVAETPNKGS